MAEQQRVACAEVIVGDAILPSTLQGDRELDQLANVTGVTLLGVNVKIDTDLDISVLLPVNRSIIVWRNSAWQKTGHMPEPLNPVIPSRLAVKVWGVDGPTSARQSHEEPRAAVNDGQCTVQPDDTESMVAESCIRHGAKPKRL